MCEGTAPDVFEVGDDGHARLLVTDISGERYEELNEAADNCPTRSVTVELVN
jgi:ferredoxin